MTIDARVKKVAKGLSAREAADAFVKQQEEGPMSLPPGMRD